MKKELTLHLCCGCNDQTQHKEINDELIRMAVIPFDTEDSKDISFRFPRRSYLIRSDESPGSIQDRLRSLLPQSDGVIVAEIAEGYPAPIKPSDGGSPTWDSFQPGMR
jgi:hypothetical protein